MEARVDLRKLQLLNDRINQTIDALNQVRLSVQGLSHTGVMGPVGGVNPGIVGQLGIPGVGVNVPPVMQNPLLPFLGIQHTGLGQMMLPQVGVQGLGIGQVPLWGGIGVPPWLMGLGGLTHTNPEVIEQRLLELRAIDPIRLMQTFPNAFVGVVPQVGLW